MNLTLDKILFTQSPALFLAAALLILSYFVRRSNHHARAILDLLLGIVCIGLGIALYYLGMLNGLFTIKNFWQVRTPGIVGLVVVAVLAVILLFRSVKHSIQRHRTEKQANRIETAHQKELEEVRQKAYASGMADAMAAETKMVPVEEPAVTPDTVPGAPADTETSKE